MLPGLAKVCHGRVNSPHSVPDPQNQTFISKFSAGILENDDLRMSI